MATYLFPDDMRLSSVEAIQAPFETAASIGLLKTLMPISPQPTLEELEDEEADYTGYARKDIAALPEPYFDTNRGGVSFQLPTQQYQVTAPGSGDELEGNTIYGCFWLDTDDNILAVATWNPGVPMLAVGDALPLDLIANFFSATADKLVVNINGVPV